MAVALGMVVLLLFEDDQVAGIRWEAAEIATEM
jgi:hypothetical protein